MTPGSPGYTAAIVAAQVLVQIGAFTLPALLPHYLEDWSLTGLEAGWLIGIFFAAYVVAVPVLVSLTDRLPARLAPDLLAGPLRVGEELDPDVQARAAAGRVLRRRAGSPRPSGHVRRREEGRGGRDG